LRKSGNEAQAREASARSLDALETSMKIQAAVIERATRDAAAGGAGK
jgi:hypothetical protein